jgi:hypothetical protein
MQDIIPIGKSNGAITPRTTGRREDRFLESIFVPGGSNGSVMLEDPSISSESVYWNRRSCTDIRAIRTDLSVEQDRPGKS